MTDEAIDLGATYKSDPAITCVEWSNAGWPNVIPVTLRDWFAGQALAGILASAQSEKWTQQMAAEIAYMQADAMLRARQGDGK